VEITYLNLVPVISTSSLMHLLFAITVMSVVSVAVQMKMTAIDATQLVPTVLTLMALGVEMNALHAFAAQIL
jgi:hypothetical protein